MLPYEINTLDQCAYGATLEGQPIKRGTDLVSDKKLKMQASETACRIAQNDDRNDIQKEQSN